MKESEVKMNGVIEELKRVVSLKEEEVNQSESKMSELKKEIEELVTEC